MDSHQLLAIQRQLTYHYGLFYNRNANVSVRTPTKTDIPVFIQDSYGINTSSGCIGTNCFGEHQAPSLTYPLGVVYIYTNATFWPSLPVALSHEIMEVLEDPAVNRWAVQPVAEYSNLCQFEIVDPVEGSQTNPWWWYYIDPGDGSGYQPVANFVYPNFFDPNGTPETYAMTCPGHTAFDINCMVTTPFQQTKGGLNCDIVFTSIGGSQNGLAASLNAQAGVAHSFNSSTAKISDATVFQDFVLSGVNGRRPIR